MQCLFIRLAQCKWNKIAEEKRTKWSSFTDVYQWNAVVS